VKPVYVAGHHRMAWKHPGQEIRDGQVFTQPWSAPASEKARGIPDRVIYYPCPHDRGPPHVAPRRLRSGEAYGAPASARP